MSIDESRHVSVWVNRRASDVYAFASVVDNLPKWAAGLSNGLGDISFSFVPANELGVLDHVVTLPSGQTIYNPMRALPAANASEEHCELVFTIRRMGQSDEQFDADTAAVQADLETLKGLLEK
jgi:hypothetical protein